MRYTFSNYNDNTHTDWLSYDDVGVDAPAYLLTGYLSGGDYQRDKQLVYMTTHFAKTDKLVIDPPMVWHNPYGTLDNGYVGFGPPTIGNGASSSITLTGGIPPISVDPTSYGGVTTSWDDTGSEYSLNLGGIFTSFGNNTFEFTAKDAYDLTASYTLSNLVLQTSCFMTYKYYPSLGSEVFQIYGTENAGYIAGQAFNGAGLAFTNYACSLDSSVVYITTNASYDYVSGLYVGGAQLAYDPISTEWSKVGGSIFSNSDYTKIPEMVVTNNNGSRVCFGSKSTGVSSGDTLVLMSRSPDGTLVVTDTLTTNASTPSGFYVNLLKMSDDGKYLYSSFNETAVGTFIYDISSGTFNQIYSDLTKIGGMAAISGENNPHVFIQDYALSTPHTYGTTILSIVGSIVTQAYIGPSIYTSTFFGTVEWSRDPSYLNYLIVSSQFDAVLNTYDFTDGTLTKHADITMASTNNSFILNNDGSKMVVSYYSSNVLVLDMYDVSGITATKSSIKPSFDPSNGFIFLKKWIEKP